MGGCFHRLTKLGGLLGCTAYFACPQGGLKGLAISAATLLSGVVWAMVIIYGSALAPHLEILGYVITGIVAFLMCIQAKQLLLSFVPGTFIGACATFAGQGDWKLVLPSLALGLVFGYAMKTAACGWRRVVQRRLTVSRKSKIKREGHSRFRLNSKMPDDNSGFLSVRIPVEPTYGGISPECRSAVLLCSANPTDHGRYHH